MYLVSLGPRSSLDCGWRKWLRDMDGSYLYIECLDSDSQQGVVFQLGGFTGANKKVWRELANESQI
jgi:hypothetical protein